MASFKFKSPYSFIILANSPWNCIGGGASSQQCARTLSKMETDPFEKEMLLEEAQGMEYEANDIEEFFAEGFAKYYLAKRPFFEEMVKDKNNHFQK